MQAGRPVAGPLRLRVFRQPESETGRLFFKKYPISTYLTVQT
ncbi:hypothetical protein HMPREF9371_1202 [Neisseria shayeganii 871]|uniref:Uncharacterized protein n=1 Tax=Neisseria shayeganii 871 TaxID=1032488 RepID=G4CHW3_9NEIS|nr:hypothetical protein HMPREF9371_1202 [Neisseria shayeganii 871]